MFFLKNFIAGMLFIIIGLPILDSAAAVIASAAEIAKGKCALKVSKINEQLSETQSPTDSVVHAIGFAAPTEEDEYDDED